MSHPPTGDRTMMVTAPVFHRSGKAWRDFRFTQLEKVSKAHLLLLRRLEHLLPGTGADDPLETVKQRLGELLEENVRLHRELTHVIGVKDLPRYIREPTLLSIVAPLPHKTRGLLEVDLALAHATIDLLLGGAGDTAALRPLTDLEEGVMSYVMLEVLKVLSPGLAPGIPRLRLEGICAGLAAAEQLLADEAQVAVVQIRCILGQQAGFARLFVPASVLAMSAEPLDEEARKSRRSLLREKNFHRLARVRTALRAEIGHAEISSRDLSQLSARDVILLDALTARPDQGIGGSARLRLGTGQLGWLDAELVLEEGRYLAKITAFCDGPSDDGHEAEGGSSDPANERGNVDGSELINDIPLQISVELARVNVTADDVIALKVGQVVELDRVPGEPVDLSVQGKVVARGELVEVEGHLGVRIIDLVG